jgi:hypothetical protein
MIYLFSDNPPTLSIANTTIDVEDAIRFLDRLSSPNQPHTFQTFDDDKDRKDSALVRIIHGTLDDVLVDLTMLNATGGGIFVCVNATDFKGRRAENVKHIRANCVDLDGAPVEPILMADPPAHVIIETSPDRFSAFWFVDGERLEEFSDIQSRLAVTFNSDPSVHDLPRVMRLPGFFHNKAVPFRSRIVKWHDAPNYTPADLERLLGEIPSSSKGNGHNDSAPDSFFKMVNHIALGMSDRWVLELFPKAKKKNGVWRVSSKSLGRKRQEDLSISPQGIKDFGEHDMGDAREGKRTAIDLMIAYGGKADAVIAALALCELLNILPASLGWDGDPDACWRTTEAPQFNPPPACSLDAAHAVFKKWLGDQYDMDTADMTLVALASEKLTGDPLWLLLIGGPGASKTETVQAAEGADALIESTIASEGALLSATSAKSKASKEKATGGLLRRLGSRGTLVLKDFTSILSADRSTRTQVLAAIREIYDGRWSRNVGIDGGRTIAWEGRIIVIGAVTTEWDSHHAVVASMGDRFVCLRLDSNNDKVRLAAGKQALGNIGKEQQMRDELKNAVGGVIAGMCCDEVPLTEKEEGQLLKAANITTMARTAVERDYQGEVIKAHAPEMPTRFAKQLSQTVKGAVAIGMSRERAMELAIRCARDSIPPLRVEILLDVAMNPNARPNEVRTRVQKPWNTIRRELQALHILGLLSCAEGTEQRNFKTRLVYQYSIAAGFDIETLRWIADWKKSKRMEEVL